MRTKSPLLILGIGIAGIIALGLMTKVALESNPDLLKLGKIREAIAEDFSSRGVEAFGVKALPRKRGYDLRIEVPREVVPDAEVLARSMAEGFIRRFTGPAPTLLKLTLIEPGRGCSGPAPWFEKEVRVFELTAEMELRAALGRLAEAIAGREGCRMRPPEPREPLRIDVDIPAPRDEASLEETFEFLKRKARELVAAGTTRKATIAVHGGPGSPVLKEETVEPRRAFRRRPASPVTPAAGRNGGPGNASAGTPAGVPGVAPGVAPGASVPSAPKP